MRLVVSIALGAVGACAVVFLDSIVGDVIGGAMAICALAVIARSVIRLAGEAGAPRERPVSTAPGSSPEVTSRIR